ncbi:hypothetical protein J6590_098541 [Homalodisca vitripennis]|nr:hypothetical protein J6590_029326 [Homalodisca vitripennis]KAG8289726.1 hypothetical protein J6590_098541 [Homalodisca vitripennis]
MEGMRHRQCNPTPRILTDNGNRGHPQLRQSVRPNLVQTVQYSKAATLQNDQTQYRLGEVKSNSGLQFAGTAKKLGTVSVSVLNLRGSAAITVKRKVSKQRIADVIRETLCGSHTKEPETFELTVCFPEGRQTVVTAWDPMLEALNEAIENNHEETESSVTFSYPPASEIKTSNRTECFSCHEMDELRKESGPTPNTSYQVIQKEGSAEHDFEMLNESDVTLSRASSPCLSIMEDFECVDRELGKDFQETSPKTNVNSSNNYITTIQGSPQRMQPPQPEKTEAPEEINKHVLDCSLNVRNLQAVSNKPKRYRPKRVRIFNPDGTFVRIDVRKLPPELR